MKKVRNKAIRVDFFERISEYFVDRLEPKIDPLQEKYLELRTLHVIIEKALEGLLELRSIEFIG